MPKGTLLKQNRPMGVIKVVSRRDSFVRGICQNPELASSLVNTLAPDSWANVSSTLGRGWTSRRTLSSGQRRSSRSPTFSARRPFLRTMGLVHQLSRSLPWLSSLIVLGQLLVAAVWQCYAVWTVRMALRRV